jgi:hypothetical protein
MIAVYCCKCENKILKSDILCHRENVAYHFSCLIDSFLDDIEELEKENKRLRRLYDNARRRNEVERDG